MRFPIIVKVRYGTYPEYADISAGLQESLRSEGILDTETNEARQGHFDLAIEESPLFVCLSEFFDMTGQFHVGCSVDERPPSFSFSVEKMLEDGEVSLAYSMEMDFDVFKANGYFRKPDGTRDILKTAEALNGNCKESVGLYYTTRRSGFTTFRAELEFYDDRLRSSNFNGLVDPKSPLYRIADDGIKVVAKNIRDGQLIGTGYMSSDLVFGLLQIAGRIFPTKSAIESNKNRIVETCSGYM